MSITLIFISIFFLIGYLLLSALQTAFHLLGHVFVTKQVESRPKVYLFYYLLSRKLNMNHWEAAFFIISTTKQICLITYVAISVFAFLHLEQKYYSIHQTIYLLVIGLGILLLPVFTNFFGKILAEIKSTTVAKTAALISNCYILVFFPITLPLMSFRRIFFRNIKQEKDLEATKRLKYRILDLIQESEIASQIDPYDRRLISSMASFRERVVREIMVPRINTLCVSADQTIEKAAQLFFEESYSRIPVYENDIDHMIGVLLFKDILQIFIKNSLNQGTLSLNTPIKEIIKPIIYTPETKRISKLLQEFRNKQIHLAIVVDEYGGTEGIVTIEDILEELVGEIADEYDFDEALLFKPESNGGWIIDARMNIVDIEKELKIQIPKSPEYDTIGGYIFHKAGTIPVPGFRLHHDNFDLIVISCGERSVEKVRIVPL